MLYRLCREDIFKVFLLTVKYKSVQLPSSLCNKLTKLQDVFCIMCSLSFYLTYFTTNDLTKTFGIVCRRNQSNLLEILNPSLRQCKGELSGCEDTVEPASHSNWFSLREILL